MKQIIKRNNIHIALSMLASMALTMTACTESMEEKAAREIAEYNQKMCPTPWVNDSRTDSAAFDKETKTFTYYLTLRGKADNAEVIKANKEKLRQAQKASLDGNPGIKTYKENHFSFRFVYHSESQKGIVLIDEMFKY